MIDRRRLSRATLAWRWASRTEGEACMHVANESTASAVPDGGRRRLLHGLAALVASGYMPPGAAQPAPANVSAATFAAMSRTIAGYAYDDDLAGRMLAALTSAVGAANLAQIATLAAVIAPGQLGNELKLAGVDGAATIVVTALYSGVVETTKGPIVITYDRALAWQAVPWTKPNAECGGPTNYWAMVPKP
jgi:hypothetical protein